MADGPDDRTFVAMAIVHLLSTLPKALVATDHSGVVFTAWFGPLHLVDAGAVLVGLVVRGSGDARGWGTGLVIGGITSLRLGDVLAVLIQAGHA